MTRTLADLDPSNPGELAELLPVVYRELRALADQLLVHERRGHTLQPTALVHEALAKLLGRADLRFDDGRHLFATAARAMRQVLVDSARRMMTLKHGGGRPLLSLDHIGTVFETPDADLVALDGALDRLAELDPRQSRIVELKYFGGLTLEQTAEVLGLSLATVKREWQLARAWLFRELCPDTTQS